VTAPEPLLAAVVIARNEEALIARCLESVLRAVAPYGACAVVLVDSCSRDRTVEIARRFPIEIVEMRPDAPLSAALGRLVGERRTASRYVLFVDGDTEIAPGWLPAALEYLERHPDVGGVAGKLREVYYRDGRRIGGREDLFEVGPVPEEADQLGGNAVYRRRALEAAGSFNPYIVSYEEAELAERLRRAGYRVVRLPVELGTHHTDERLSLDELRRHVEENLIRGYGQTLRVALGQGLFWVHARRMRRNLQTLALLAAGILAGATSLVLRDPRWILGWALGCLAVVLAFMVRSRSVVKPLRLVRSWVVWSGPLVLGFLERPRDPRQLDLGAVVARVSRGGGVGAVRQVEGGRC
jgi:GT2 family glycosyltransferase